MTEDQLVSELSTLTKLTNPRDRNELERLKGQGLEAMPVVPETLVDATLGLFLPLKPADLIPLFSRLIDKVPGDVLMVLNQRLAKRPAYVEVLRSVHQYNQAGRPA